MRIIHFFLYSKSAY